MISIIIPVNHKDRVGNVNSLYKKIKEEAGVPVEVIVACDNPAIYDLLTADNLVKIPKRIGFTQSVNLAEKFSTNDLVWFMDDSVTPDANWAKEAIDTFWKTFPKGKGLLEISGADHCATRCIGTREFLYSLNMNQFFWPEYIHCGDTELYERLIDKGQIVFYKELLHETKYEDESRSINKKVFAFDDQIRAIRRSLGYPLSFIPNWQELFKDYCKDDEKLMELYNNLFNL